MDREVEHNQKPRPGKFLDDPRLDRSQVMSFQLQEMY